MLDKISDFLNSKIMLLISAIGAFGSLVFYIKDIHVWYDLGWISIVVSGLPIMIEAYNDLTYKRKISSALLISLAIFASIYIGEIFAAAEVAFIMAIGEMLEKMTIKKSKKGLKKLISQAPSTGRVVVLENSCEVEKQVDANLILKDSIVRIKPGELIPVDGIIIKGQTSVDQSSITGESLPIDKMPNDSVYSGTINCFGSIDIKATKVGKNSTFEKLISLLKNAEDKKAPTQRIVDIWAGYLVPLALVIAIITYFATGEIVRAVTVLVVFCPCALVLATPTSIVAAIAHATKFGVIVKSGEALEKMGNANVVCFDKTGTLTHAKLEVSDILTFDIDENELVSLCVSAESLSEHPIGMALVKYAKANNIPLKNVKDFQIFAGQGIKANVENKNIICGSFEFLNQQINIANTHQAKEFANEGKALVYVGIDNELKGIFALSDKIKNQSYEVINKLKDMNIKVALLTGDNENSANTFAKKVGISSVFSSLLPEDKLNKIQSLKENNQIVAFVGDGLNDAPSLKSADIGIAMANIGSDISVDASDIVLMGDDISKIPYLKKLSNATIFSIKFNITLSMLINIIAVILSVLGVLTPVTGALVHNVGSVLVVLNAARLYDKKFDVS